MAIEQGVKVNVIVILTFTLMVNIKVLISHSEMMHWALTRQPSAYNLLVEHDL